MNEHKHELKQHDAKALAAGYSPLVRATEVSAVLVFLAGEGWLFFRLWQHLGAQRWFIWVTAVLSAYVLADFISGLFHWMGDTWGSPSTPVVGPVFVRPFREHHVDQLAITRHDFIEVNGANCLIALPPLIGLHLLPLSTGAPLVVLLAGFFGAFLFFIFLTNQFHMWAHLEERPAIVSWLQKLRLILPVDHHQIHHVAPYMKYYCITNGWLNAPLHHSGFFRVMERIVSATTGLLPRQDDIGEKAAKALAPETSLQTPARPTEQK